MRVIKERIFTFWPPLPLLSASSLDVPRTKKRQFHHYIADYTIQLDGRCFKALEIHSHFRKAMNIAGCRVKRYNLVGKQAMAYVEKQYAADKGFGMVNTMQ